MSKSAGVFARRWSALVLAAAVALTACASNGDANTLSQNGDSTDSQASSSTSDAAEVAPDGGISLGEREAGFGPGTLAVFAGEFAGRINEVEGEWFPNPSDTTEPPEVCGFPDPEARQVVTIVRAADISGTRVDVVVADVRVFETEEQADTLLGLLNGPSADECDRATLELVDNDQPGVNLDFGDGVGTPAVVADALGDANAAARSYELEITFGSVGQPVEQRVNVVADGRALVVLSVVAAPEEVSLLEEQAVAAVFTEPAPPMRTGLNLDEFAENVRRGVLDDEELPSFFEPIDQLMFAGPGSADVCFESPPPEAIASGPGWFSINPNAGTSRTAQEARVYESATAASVAFDELVERGVECFPIEFDLPDVFTLIDATSEVLEVDGRSVVLIELDFEQTVGAVTVDAESKIAITQVDETLLGMQFFGLAGDSPELVDLVATVAARSEGQ